jgi:16S rRNA pseudouridine516 synthase
LLNKPVWYVCSDEDEHYRKSYRHLIDDCCYKQMMHVAWRLDQDTEWLVILCSDGQRNHRIISPRYRCEKEYFVQLQNYCSDTDILKLQQWVRLDDWYCTLPAKVVRCGHNSIMITIVEWKYHQVKRMLEAVHNKVIFLKRLRVGDRTLDWIEQPWQRKRVL